ncbi:MAG: [FeFe] hydrogenase H-cluster maturation GTPase HydF [Oscillospiraceae bacterium]|jgi:[FeFe] hydrogenase H-cluster maturation GTPase HydF
MGLNDTPSAERVHIGFFGRRNAGKSSVVNAVTGQEMSLVSEVRGTTTDPVTKAMELLPMGPVVIIDTPGFDDEGALGSERVRRTKQTLNRTDVAVLVVDATSGQTDCDRELVGIFREKEIPYLVAYNKADLMPADYAAPADGVAVSALTGAGIQQFKDRLAVLAKTDDPKLQIVGDLLHPSDFVVLVTPIDSAAPKGRLILPQQQTIRDVLEADAAAIVIKENELRETLAALGKKPAMVITDSQVFEKVAAETPEDVPLTSFSILMARYKGFLDSAVRGVAAIDKLQDGDKILIAEGCTHHRQCDDIGTVKIPRWLKSHTGKELVFETSSGKGFPEDLTPYALIIHCGGCMLTEREVRFRVKCAEDQGIPITNYGTLIAAMQGILRRTLAPFPSLLAELGAD